MLCLRFTWNKNKHTLFWRGSGRGGNLSFFFIYLFFRHQVGFQRLRTHIFGRLVAGSQFLLNALLYKHCFLKISSLFQIRPSIKSRKPYISIEINFSSQKLLLFEIQVKLKTKTAETFSDIYWYYFTHLRVYFYSSVNWWFSTGGWVTASLFKSPGFFSVF